MNYKYIKYKKKYLELKGRNKINIIITYNLSWATQKNDSKSKSSEQEFVKKCQQSKLINIDWEYTRRQDLFPSWCTQIAFDGIINFIKEKKTSLDIIGFQECIKELFNEKNNIILNYLKNNLKENFKIINHSNINKDKPFTSIIYNNNTLKFIKSFDSHFKNEEGRPFMISLFENNFNKNKLIVINCHMPHTNTNDNLKELYETYIKNINIKIDRIIILGDFNIHNIELDIINNFNSTPKLSNPISKPISCCWPNFNYIGDLILDSNKQKKLDILDNFKFILGIKKIYIGSDHHPIYAEY